ncbi:MAG: hypothetical protein IJM36_02065 [Acholeplasmatales bacterium]|nr:hypothetical protein [Acholeplasmatales bacterium]
MLTTILIIIGIAMGLFFLAYVFVLLIDHFSEVEGYENPKDPLKILRKIFGYGFLILLAIFFLINFLGWIGLLN